MREIKLLLVDDEQDFVETLAERLRLRDFGSTVALDGETALSIVKEGVPDVMLLDIMMPGINGLEVIERVQENYPNLHVFIVTGHGGEKEKTRAMQLGAFAYMTKPVDFETLIITIMAAFEQISVEP